MKITELINKEYLKREFIIEATKRFHTQDNTPVKYLLFPDFIEPEVFKEIKSIIAKKGYEKCDSHIKEGSHMHSIIVRDHFLSEVYGVFESEEFEKYISLFFRKKLQRDSYVLPKIDTTYKGLIAQVYGKDDFLDWHVDGPVGTTLGSFVYHVYNSLIEPTEETGGMLELGIPRDYENTEGYYKNVDTYKKISTRENTLILMVTNKDSFHRVTRVKTDMTRIMIHCSLIPRTENKSTQM